MEESRVSIFGALQRHTGARRELLPGQFTLGEAIRCRGTGPTLWLSPATQGLRSAPITGKRRGVRQARTTANPQGRMRIFGSSPFRALQLLCPAAVAAKPDLVPDAFPFFPPRERASAGGAKLFWQVLFFNAPHEWSARTKPDVGMRKGCAIARCLKRIWDHLVNKPSLTTPHFVSAQRVRKGPT